MGSGNISDSVLEISILKIKRKIMRNKCNVFASFFALVFCIVSTVPVFGQTSAPDGWYYEKSIKSVNFEGLENVKSSDLEGITSGFIGKKFTDLVYEDLVNRIFSLNYFDDIEDIYVKPADGNYATCRSIHITLKVKEYPVICRIKFSGYRQVKYSELSVGIASKEKEIYSLEKRNADEITILEIYRSKGYTDVKVASQAELTENGYVLTFIIDEGKQTVVSEISFEGNKSVSANNLSKIISLKKVSPINKGSYQSSMLEKDSRTIEAFYREKGYVDAKVLNTEVKQEFNEEKGRIELLIKFNISEGTLYEFAGISFRGNNVFSVQELSRLVTLDVGKVYNEKKLQESVFAIRNKYYENGYTSNGFQLQMDKNPSEKTIAYVLIITETSRSHIENITVKGNRRTKEETIFREISIQPGDVFSNAKITSAMRNLYSLQFFSQVYPEIEPGSEPNLIDLVFNVEEQNTISLDMGLTFSGVSDPGDTPVSGFVKIQDSNLFGEGKTASAAINYANNEQSISLSYGQNWLFDKPIGNSTSVEFRHSKENALRNFVNDDGSVDSSNYYMEFDAWTFGITEAFSRRWTPDFAILSLTGGLSGNLINNVYRSDLYTPADSSIVDYSNTWEPKNYIFGAFSMDGRNISYDPTKGWFASERLSWYGLIPRGIFGGDFGETEFYLRSDSKGEIYFTLMDVPLSESYNLKFVLMGYSGLSMMFPVASPYIKQSNQLYLDGLLSGRGWKIYNTPEGRGLAMLNNTIELRSPVVPNVLSLDMFFDASVVKDSMNELFTDIGNMNDWYFSWGPSIRFTMSQFPLRFLVASKFKIDDTGFSWVDAYGSKTNSFWDSWDLVLSVNITNR